MDQIFNELSVSGGYASRQDARVGMSESVKISKALKALGFNRTIRTTQDFRQRRLCQNYTIDEWAFDKASVEMEERLYFLTVASQGPFLEEILGTIETQQGIVFDSTLNGDRAVGLGVAYLKDTPVLSLGNDVRFRNDPISISILSLGSEESLESEVDVCNLSNEIQLANRTECLRERLARSVVSGEELWQRKEELFSNLMWCSDTKNQITNLTGNEYYFHRLISHLSKIDLSIKEWNGGEYQLPKVTCSPESASTIQQYGHLREFTCPDGEDRMFTLHTKLMGANQRIYFYPDLNNDVVYIGYIGIHLPYSGEN